MKRYLLHLAGDGMPLGLHTETDSVYLENTPQSVVDYGTAVARSKGSETTWEQHCARLADQGQSRARWLPFWSSRTDLREVLIEERGSAQYSVN